jgi:hypothetical protein
MPTTLGLPCGEPFEPVEDFETPVIGSDDTEGHRFQLAFRPDRRYAAAKGRKARAQALDRNQKNILRL